MGSRPPMIRVGGNLAASGIRRSHYVSGRRYLGLGELLIDQNTPQFITEDSTDDLNESFLPISLRRDENVNESCVIRGSIITSQGEVIHHWEKTWDASMQHYNGFGYSMSYNDPSVDIMSKICCAQLTN